MTGGKKIPSLLVYLLHLNMVYVNKCHLLQLIKNIFDNEIDISVVHLIQRGDFMDYSG